MNRKLLLTGVLLAAVLAAAFYQLRTPYTQGNKTGLFNEVSSQQLLDHIRDLKSPVVLVNFWASWCEPCKQEFPELLSLREKFAAKGLKVVFVSIDDPKDAQTAEAFLREQHVDFPTFFKGSNSLEFVTQIYPKWEGALPTSLLFGPDLKILDSWEGETTLPEFEAHVTRFLGGS